MRPLLMMMESISFMLIHVLHVQRNVIQTPDARARFHPIAPCAKLEPFTTRMNVSIHAQLTILLIMSTHHMLSANSAIRCAERSQIPTCQYALDPLQTIARFATVN
jgi:hypothetical protein